MNALGHADPEVSLIGSEHGEGELGGKRKEEQTKERESSLVGSPSVDFSSSLRNDR